MIYPPLLSVKYSPGDQLGPVSVHGLSEGLDPNVGTRGISGWNGTQGDTFVIAILEVLALFVLTVAIEHLVGIIQT